MNQYIVNELVDYIMILSIHIPMHLPLIDTSIVNGI